MRGSLSRFGGGLGFLVLADGAWWRLITSIFLRGLLHFGFNSCVLIQLGPMVEETSGIRRGFIGETAALTAWPRLAVRERRNQMARAG